MPQKPNKYDKAFLKHVSNIQGYKERHNGKLPIGWNFDYAVPENPSPDVRAQVSLTQLFMNTKKAKNVATWRENMLPAVGITRDEHGVFQRDPSTYE